MRRSLLTTGRLCGIAAVFVPTAIAVALLPQLIWLGQAARPWQHGMVLAQILFGLLLQAWIYRGLEPVSSRPMTNGARRRAAHDFPFRLARMCFGAAVLSGLGTTAWIWVRKADPSSALVAGVLTYLLLALPVVAVYLLTWRIFRVEVAGPPPNGPLGLRQSVGLRLTFAVQLPVVVCAVGIVLTEQHSGAEYSQNLETYYRQRYVRTAERAVRALATPAARRRFTAALEPPDGVVVFADPDGTLHTLVLPAGESPGRSLSLRMPPFLLLALVTLLSALLAKWLAREATSELDQVTRALDRMQGHAAPRPDNTAQPVKTVALRETRELVDAFERAVVGFRQREIALKQAAASRREAEHAKSSFLAHISHELKSPLNSILGFTEVLLAELDGPLNQRQRERLWIVWRSGDNLLRFILALLDLARLERTESSQSTMTTLNAQPTAPETLVTLIMNQSRPDPLGRLDLVLTVAPDAVGRQALLDREHTARGVVLLVGLLHDRMDSGVVEVALGLCEQGQLQIEVHVSSGEAEAQAVSQLAAELGAPLKGLPREPTPIGAWPRPTTRFGAASATAVLLEGLAQAQAGTFSMTIRGWPRFQLRFPIQTNDA